MTTNKTTSLNDLPRNPNHIGQDEYQLGIDPYVKGLVNFLKGTTTPMTVALQGEWGSGKTSLMYKLQDELCGKSDSDYDSVWINTWEYSLMSEPSQALLQIIAKMAAATQPTTLASEKAKNIIGKLAKGVAKTALGVSIGDSSIVDAISDIFSTGGESSVGQLQQELKKNIQRRFEESDKRGIIFFIDDLDRLNPATAVELLELLKNIFTIERCVFILAIDYDVVVKGLKGKFGELTDKNEREFRSFFDKIIQVPFAMPVSNYHPKGFITSSLLEIGYLDLPDTKDNQFVKNILIATKYTVGNNPRSIKRLMNILSLIKCISNATDQQTDSDFNLNHKIGKLINYVVLALQVQFPKISRMLAIEPNFTDWNSDIVKKMNASTLSEEQIKNLQNFKTSDEVWEQALYAICADDTYLKGKFLELSELLNLLRSEINYHLEVIRSSNPDAPTISLGEVMYEAVKMSSVTNFNVGDSNPIAINESDWSSMVYRFHEMISLRLQSMHPDWAFRPRKNTGNGGFNFSKPEVLRFPFHRTTSGNMMLMKFQILDEDGNWNRCHINAPCFATLQTQEDIINHPLVASILERTDSYMNLLMQKNDWIEWSGLVSHHKNPSNFNDGEIIHAPWWNFKFTDIESFVDQDNVRIMADIIAKMVEFEMELYKTFKTEYQNI